MRQHGLSTIVVVLGCGCSHVFAPSHASNGSDEPPLELPILREYAGADSRLTRLVRLVIRDAATFAQLPLVDMEVDFDREMVLLVGLGPTHADAVRVRIARVRRRGRRLVVDTRMERVTADTSTPLRRTSPYHLVVVPRSDWIIADFETRVTADLLGGV